MKLKMMAAMTMAAFGFASVPPVMVSTAAVSSVVSAASPNSTTEPTTTPTTEPTAKAEWRKLKDGQPRIKVTLRGTRRAMVLIAPPFSDGTPGLQKKRTKVYHQPKLDKGNCVQWSVVVYRHVEIIGSTDKPLTWCRWVSVLANTDVVAVDADYVYATWFKYRTKSGEIYRQRGIISEVEGRVTTFAPRLPRHPRDKIVAAVTRAEGFRSLKAMGM